MSPYFETNPSTRDSQKEPLFEEAKSELSNHEIKFIPNILKIWRKVVPVF